jgi:hypothetical protein
MSWCIPSRGLGLPLLAGHRLRLDWHLHLGALIQDDGRKLRIGRLQLQVVLEGLENLACRLVAILDRDHQITGQWGD